jgi:tRNA 2-thiouridine synthesizing protein A
MSEEILDIDARGHRCPTPTLRLQKALRGVAHGDCVRLAADDPMARIDVPHFAQQNGHSVISIHAEGATIYFTVKKG